MGETRGQGLILAVTPAQEQKAQQGAILAHMAYRIDAQQRLTRLGGAMPASGGLLYLAIETPLRGNAEALTAQLLRECAARRYQGVVADLPDGCAGWAQALERALTQRQLTLYLPEQHAIAVPRARVLVSTAISGGTLRERLESAVRRYGAERTVAALERRAEDFPLPCRTGCGRALTAEELIQLRRKVQANVYWSPELCARYFTYVQEQRPHFVLFDDRETMRAKRKTAQAVGISVCMATWADLQE